MPQKMLIAPIIGNNPLSPNQISDYIHKSFSAFSNTTNIDTSVSSMGILTNICKSGGYEVLVPKKDSSVEMTISHYRNHVKPVFQKALQDIRCAYEKNFIELQNRIILDLKKATLDYCREDSTYQDLAYFNFVYQSLCMEYQTYAYSNYHFLYYIGLMGFKDAENYISLHVVPYSFPSISY